VELRAMYACVKQALTPQRYKHTLGVVEAALSLSEKYGADPHKAEVAAIFHDYAKFRPEPEMAEIIRSTDDIPDDLLQYNKELWHSFVGAHLVQTEIGIQDKDILKAIRYHTTGRVGMTILEKVVCLADYIEPGRSFPGVEQIREKAEHSLDGALAAALAGTVQFLEQKGEQVYPLTIKAYNSLRR
jgi:predicted HD superfamily hydrolase involved in NAD metabolism